MGHWSHLSAPHNLLHSADGAAAAHKPEKYQKTRWYLPTADLRAANIALLDRAAIAHQLGKKNTRWYLPTADPLTATIPLLDGANGLLLLPGLPFPRGERRQQPTNPNSKKSGLVAILA